MDRVTYWNTISSPQSVHVKETILEHLLNGRVEDSPDPRPGLEFGLHGAPIVSTSLSQVLERDYQGYISGRSEPDAGYPLATGLYIHSHPLGWRYELFGEPVKLAQERFGVDDSFWSADLGILGFSSGFLKVEDCNVSLGVASLEDIRGMERGEDFFSW